jgi:hypothetical protein
MSVKTIEMLTPHQVHDLWPLLKDYFDSACKANEIAAQEITAEHIYYLGISGMAAIFVYSEDGVPTCTVAIQFGETNGRKSADIISLGGKNLIRSKILYWNVILDWLRANDVEFVNAYASERLAKIYLKKFGFDKSCVYVRMNLRGDEDEQRA